MDKNTIEAEKISAEQKFNSLQTERDQLVKRIEDIDDEHKRLQGEYRLLDRMKSTLAEPANIIKVEEKKSGRKPK